MNNTNTNSKRSNFIIRYGSEKQEVNADTLIYSLYDIKIISEELYQRFRTDTPPDISVTAVKGGSVVVYISAGTAIINLVAALIAIWVLIKKEKLLDNAPPKDLVITDLANGSNISIDDFKRLISYSEYPVIRETLYHLLGIFDRDPNLSSFGILEANGNSLIHIDRAEISDVVRDRASHSALIAKELDGQLTISKKATLYALSSELDAESKGDFIYEHIEISATVTDTQFLGLMNAINRRDSHHFSFDNCKVLFVELEIDREFKNSTGVLVNKAYRIVAIYNYPFEYYLYSGELPPEPPPLKDINGKDRKRPLRPNRRDR
ncbi:MAG: hypothetical protein WBV94_05625 [Blastocatellia bacterium]